MKKLMIALMALGLAFFTACSQPAEEPVVTDADTVVEETTEAVEGAADEATEAVEEAADEVEEEM